VSFSQTPRAHTCPTRPQIDTASTHSSLRAMTALAVLDDGDRLTFVPHSVRLPLLTFTPLSQPLLNRTRITPSPPPPAARSRMWTCPWSLTRRPQCASKGSPRQMHGPLLEKALLYQVVCFLTWRCCRPHVCGRTMGWLGLCHVPMAP
jgi:hypothetical protein